MTNPLTILASGSGNLGNETNAGNKIDYVGGGSGDELVGNVTNIINGIIAALGIVAVVIIIIGGVSYMTSSGDASKVKKAKDTILYGVIGLVICILAFAIVNFVIKNIIG
ncbi:hypothetical protein IJ118_03610 [Candidatus Saccharibacteria bacterium]|nr:hypothetical protein [Candidatus Saccharibacteria bacterium]